MASPAQHFIESERLLAVAESTGTDPTIQQTAALAGIGHALLAQSPRRARKVPPPPGRHTGMPTAQRWLYGTDDKES